MTVGKLLFLGVIIGSNNLAAALALGALGQVGCRWRVTGVFGVSEFLSPLLGFLIGRQSASYVAERADWLGTAALAIMGVVALVAAVRRDLAEEEFAAKVTDWKGLLLLAVALTPGNLVVGFSLGLAKVPPVLTAATISMFAMVFTWTGMTIGGKIRREWEKVAEIGAALMLVGLAVMDGMGWL